MTFETTRGGGGFPHARYNSEGLWDKETLMQEVLTVQDLPLTQGRVKGPSLRGLPSICVPRRPLRIVSVFFRISLSTVRRLATITHRR